MFIKFEVLDLDQNQITLFFNVNDITRIRLNKKESETDFIWFKNAEIYRSNKDYSFQDKSHSYNLKSEIFDEIIAKIQCTCL